MSHLLCSHEASLSQDVSTLGTTESHGKVQKFDLVST